MMHKVVNLIHTLEQRRQRLVDGAEPLRHQQVAQAVIKRSMHDNPNGEKLDLVQYDRGVALTSWWADVFGNLMGT